MLHQRVMIGLLAVVLFANDTAPSFARNDQQRSVVTCLVDGVLGPLFGESTQSSLGRIRLIRKEGRSGAWYRDSAGQKWYLKPDEKYSELQTSAEIITSSIYRKLGYDAAETRLVYLRGRRYSAAREIVGGKPVTDFAKLDTPEFRKLRFHAAYLQDWDRSVRSNTLVRGSEDFSLIDFGGSLGSRAKGSPKPGVIQSAALGTFKPSRSVDEILDNFNIDGLSAEHPWHHATVEDVRAAVTDLKKLDNASLIEIVNSAGYTKTSDRDTMIAALIHNRDLMIEQLEEKFISSAAAPRISNSVPSISKSLDFNPDKAPLHPTLEEIDQHVFAVHATHYLPKDGVIVAGATTLLDNKLMKESGYFRPTTHFSLGEVVRPHTEARNSKLGARWKHSWEDRPYAIVIPLRKLRNDIVNLNPYDTFIIGDVKVPSGSIYVLPDETRILLPPNTQAVFYNPHKETIRSAVDRAIEEQQGWKIRMEDGKFDGSYRIGNQEYTNDTFFKALLEVQPYLETGLHARFGRGLGRIYKLEKYSRNLNLTTSLGGVDNPRIQELNRALVRHQLTKLQDELGKPGIPKNILNAFNAKSIELQEWLNLQDASDFVRKQFKMDLNGLPERNLAQIRKLRSNPIALQKYLNRLKFDPLVLGSMTQHHLGKVLDKISGWKPTADWEFWTLENAVGSLPAAERREFVQALDWKFSSAEEEQRFWKEMDERPEDKPSKY